MDRQRDDKEVIGVLQIAVEVVSSKSCFSQIRHEIPTLNLFVGDIDKTVFRRRGEELHEELQVYEFPVRYLCHPKPHQPTVKDVISL